MGSRATALIFSDKALAALTVLSLVLAAGALRGQQQVGGDKFKMAEYWPLHETQMRSLLEGGKFRNQPDGTSVITDAHLQTFTEDGQSELVVHCPECVYHPKGRSLDSAGALQVQTADGKFSIAGEGFFWQQTNSSLFISNRVHTIVHPDLLGAAGSEAPTNSTGAKGIEIFSERFAYGANTGKGIYEGNVRAAGTNLTLTSERLTVVLPMHERQLQSILAEQQVIIDYGTVHSTGERVTYSAATGIVQVQDHPTWRTEQREGHGNELVIDLTNKVFRANGNAWMKMPSQSMGASGFLPRSPSLTDLSIMETNRVVEIESENYEIRTNSAAFEGNVRVKEMAGEQIKGKMRCGQMSVTFAGTNELQQMVAQNDVVIEQDAAKFTAGRAVYSGNTGVLELTDRPAWRAATREGQGDLLLMNVRKNELIAHGNASMRLPANDLGQSFGPSSDAAPTVHSQSASNQFAQIFADEYSLKPAAALFQGNVCVDHPQTKWTCEQMTVALGVGTDKTRRVVAERSVVFDLTDEKGHVRGKGQKVVYTYNITPTATNDLVELTGDPSLETTNGTFRNKIIILDRAHNKLLAPGKYQMQGLAAAGATNTFQWPKKRAK
ncbi:MAG: hypothetical protein QOJ40_501 [Verrucomicrobiota bacterium]